MIAAAAAPLRSAAAAVAALRPRQWTKNVLVFAGILFAAKLADDARWVEAIGAFVAFSSASSAAYLVNDVRDAPRDRLHPVKRLRPIARGELAPRTALALAAALALGALGLAAALGATVLALVACFLGLQLAYTLGLKRLVFVDTLAIAALFVLRAATGAAAVHVRISPWLLVCTAMLALFLGIAKRRGELVLVGRGATPGRAVLDHYSLRTLDALVWASAAATLAAYTVYVLLAGDSLELTATIPLATLGVGRYVYLVLDRDLGEEPEQVMLSDRLILSLAALWTLVASLVLNGF